jgi:hypothetical protein
MATKIQQLKEQAYRLAGVKTTQALKKVHDALSHLDMRLKASWVRAIEVLENLTHGIPVWDGNKDSVDATIEQLLNYQSQLMNEMCEVALNQVSINEEFLL